MAFNNVGNLVGLGPDETVVWTYTWGTENHGTQFASADVKTANGTALVASDQTKRINPDGAVVYTVTIRNIGSQWTWHNLQGGGMS
jgi:hypothetical protein